MPNKTEEYLALACKTADSFSRQWEHWAEFLITAARLYKYSYPDQLMIYAQRPDATACAEYDVSVKKQVLSFLNFQFGKILLFFERKKMGFSLSALQFGKELLEVKSEAKEKEFC